MSYIEKEKLIKEDIASIENKVRHAFNQGYDLGFKDGKGKAKLLEQEPQSFKWCTDCKEYDQEKHCCHRYSKVIRDTVAEIEQEPRWIPVSERLPASNQLNSISISKNDLGVDLISREQAKTAIRDKFKDLPSRVEINTILNELPAVTPQEPKTGEWILSNVEGSKVWRCKCSKCNKEPLDYVGGSENWWLIRNNLPKYCPNCGAKMESED